MGLKEEDDWARLLGAIFAVIILICIWLACGDRLIKALNGGEPPNYELRRK